MTTYRNKRQQIAPSDRSQRLLSCIRRINERLRRMGAGARGDMSHSRLWCSPRSAVPNRAMFRLFARGIRCMTGCLDDILAHFPYAFGSQRFTGIIP